ncbi:MAG: phosphoribosylformylglycinamidine synthase [Lachnospiraceae bacterium]|jgi:phosphoribosylformylglycinamidine synthase
MSVRRIYVEKKEPYAVKARELEDEIRNYLNIRSVTGVRVLMRYDIENLSSECWERAKGTIFSEPPVDTLYGETFPREQTDRVFSVEYLPGQFDQRADSAMQAVQLLDETQNPVIRSATTYVISGEVSDREFRQIRDHCINPVDSRETGEQIPETLIQKFSEPADVRVMENFISEPEDALKALYQSLSLAMTWKDFLFIRDYFRDEEHRDPTITEIRVLDTYWSDHCRHTTFLTELKDVKLDDGFYRPAVEKSWKRYLQTHNEINAEKHRNRYVSLMDVALAGMRELKREGKLTDQEESDEINACSIVVPVEVDGKTEEWLVNFKNETHNHPTEIEPFGGAATCLGGAIRDPLSGRTYVYQAMRVTGAADPRTPTDRTLKGKLPQSRIVRTAARGYSSYGNQIGLATGLVKEIYHPDYVAKRMEIGAVIAAAPRKQIVRRPSDPGDIIILLGGRTGRDGCGGATGSSKAHTVSSIETCGAEVQKGNAPTERKLQRLFYRPEVSRLIKKCNDFGAGGVLVAIGELADGLVVNLDKVPKKYAGLDGTEIAISESQERMAVVVSPENVDRFLAYADSENLEATPVAVVTENPRLVLRWRGRDIVNISRSFLNTNGAHQETAVEVQMPDPEKNYFAVSGADSAPGGSGEESSAGVRDKWLSMLGELNVCSEQGLSEMFDSSIGAGTVLMPFGGKYQKTEIQTMVAKLPLLHGYSDTVTMMSYGFDPDLSSWSPYHGAAWAVAESVSKIAAAGGDTSKVHLTFQEYFQRMTEDPKGWGLPLSALLGAYDAQLGFGIASIGGKDSMSGSFDDINVPPTLVSFAVDVDSARHVVSPEMKKTGDVLILAEAPHDGYDLPDYGRIKALYADFYRDVDAGRIAAAYALGRRGIAEAVSKMAFGNRLGADLSDAVSAKALFAPAYGSLIAEVPADQVKNLSVPCTVIGTVSAKPEFTWRETSVGLAEAQEAWEKPLEKIYPEVSGRKLGPSENHVYRAPHIYTSRFRTAKPTVFIPVFPGTNCEYDSARAFERAGALTDVRVFRNQTAQEILDSADEFASAIRDAQMIMFPGGFSAGDEPDGSAKFFASAFRNEKLKEAVMDLLENRDGLVLGICNGFQTLIKLGLVPYGKIIPAQLPDSPTLTTNTIGRHISKMAYIRVVSNLSPWLAGAEPGSTYVNPASHGEGRFVATDEWMKKLAENGQIALQYVDADGNPAQDETWNINGSYNAVEGITSPDGRVLGKMTHSERIGRDVAVNIAGDQDLKIFESGVAYFR